VPARRSRHTSVAAAVGGGVMAAFYRRGSDQSLMTSALASLGSLPGVNKSEATNLTDPGPESANARADGDTILPG
jgi:hypothetical protein